MDHEYDVTSGTNQSITVTKNTTSAFPVLTLATVFASAAIIILLIVVVALLLIFLVKYFQYYYNSPHYNQHK